MIHIHFLGGEPTLRPDLLDLINYATSQGLCVTMTSNGTLISKNLAESLIRAGTEQISISIDGSTPESNDAIRGSGTFDRAIKGLRLLQNAKELINPYFELGISFTLSKQTLRELPQVVEIGCKNKVDVIVLEDLFDLGVSERAPQLIYDYVELIDAFENLATHLSVNPIKGPKPVIQLDTFYSVFRYLDRKFRPGFVTPQRNLVCPAVTNQVYMDSGGYITPCGMANNMENLGAFKSKKASLPKPTDVRSTESLKDIDFDQLINMREKHNQTRTPCSSCDYRSECLPCPYLSLANKGNKAFDVCREIFKREFQFEYPILYGSVKLHNNSVIFTNADGQLMVTDRRTGNDFHIEGCGAEIIQILSKTKSILTTQIIDVISKKYSCVNNRVITRDIIDFVWWLRLMGAFEIVLNHKAIVSNNTKYPLVSYDNRAATG